MTSPRGATSGWPSPPWPDRLSFPFDESPRLHCTIRMDGDSPLTSAGSSIVCSESRSRAGSETSQQSEGSSVKAKQRKVDESDDDYQDEAGEEEDEEMQLQASITSSAQKRKRRYSRAVPIGDDSSDDEDYSPTASGSQRQRSATSTSVSRMSEERKSAGSRARSGHTRSTSAPKRKRPTDHFDHSGDDDDRPSDASSLYFRHRSASAQSSSKDRELKRLQVDGEWGEKGQTISSWATRPKRRAASKVQNYAHTMLGLDVQVHEESAKVHAPAIAQPDEPPVKLATKKKALKGDNSTQLLPDASADDVTQLDRPPAVALPSKPKKSAKKKATKILEPEDEPIDADAEQVSLTNPAPQIPQVQQGRVKRKAAIAVSYVPQVDLDGNPLDESDFGPSTSSRSSKSKMGRSKARVSKVKEAVGGSDPSSYDSLFDANLMSEDDEARQQRKLVEQSQAKTQDTKKNRTTLVVKRRLAARSEEDTHDAGIVLLTRGGKTYTPQTSLCQRQKQFQRCRYCVAKQAGDTCRFIGIRALPVLSVDGQIEYLSESTREHGPIFIDDVTLNEDVVLPDHFDLNRPMDDGSKIKIMTTTAISLVGILREALEHAKKPNCIRRARELQIRAMCDYCSTGLFSASYLCTTCGGEYCLPCRNAMEAATLEDKLHNQLYSCVKDKYAERPTRPAISIGKGKGNRASHAGDMMMPVSRFDIEELQEEVTAMEKVIEEHASSIPTSTMKPEAEQCDHLTSQPHCFNDELPSHPLTLESKNTMDQARFLSTWSKGEPLVVTDVSTRHSWDPTAFIDKYGTMACDIVRCDEYAPYVPKEKASALLRADPTYFYPWEKPVKVHEFFETFGKPYEERATVFGHGIWKLKDWPPAAEFSTAFPDIYEDFNYAVPMPDFTRRDGCINISSLFPKNANGPDLGPKMYNAWPGEHSKGQKGTTCLHMDIADAVNILLYTAEREGAEQAAQWDIFRAEDANAIRDFIRERHPESANKGDPIHAQVHFLDDEALKDLYAQKGVYSWRILQRSGQAVFIPAGCAHQVCNLTDCIKVAVDFISPQNVARCFQLTEEFRGLTLEGRKSWKEDVLQLKAQLWYAWKACRMLPLAPSNEKFEREVLKRERKRQLQLQEAEVIEQRRVANKLRKARDAKPTGSPTKESITPEQDLIVELDGRQRLISQSTEGAEASTAGGDALVTTGEVVVKEEEPEIGPLAAEVEPVALKLNSQEEIAGETVAQEKIAEAMEEATHADATHSVEIVAEESTAGVLILNESAEEKVTEKEADAHELVVIENVAVDITADGHTTEQCFADAEKPSIAEAADFFAEKTTVMAGATLELTQASSDAADDTFQSAEGTPEPTTPDPATKPAELATLSAYSEDGFNTPSPLPAQSSDCIKAELS